MIDAFCHCSCLAAASGVLWCCSSALGLGEEHRLFFVVVSQFEPLVKWVNEETVVGSRRQRSNVSPGSRTM